MKAIILAAGEAKRLKPLSENLPKCMLKVGEERIIDYQINNLIKAGVKDVVVVTGFLAEKLEEHLSSHFPNLNLTFIRSEDYYKTYPAHGLWLAREHLKGDVIYLNADVICHPDIIGEIVKSPHPTVTAIHRNDWDEEQVNVLIKEETGEVLSMGKYISQELSYGEFIGVTKMSSDFNKRLVEVLEHFIEREEFKKFAADAINLTIQRGSVMYALDLSHLPAIEIDTYDDLVEANVKIEQIL